MKFSIIIVSLNPGKELRNTVNSVYKQTHKDWEIIIKDGGSNDGAIEKLLKNPRMKVVVKKDQSIYDAMNQALSYVTGEYLLFLNCGDYLYEDRTLEKVANAIMEADTMPGIIYGNQYERNLGTQVYSNPKITPFTCYRNIPCHQTCFYRKELFETRGYDLQFPVRADYEHFLWCYFEKKTVLVHLEEIVCSYEGAGFSETKEHLKMAKKEHHKITKMYLSIPQRIVFRSILLLTLQPLRTTIANSKRLSGIYNRVKSLIYQKKKG